MLDQALVHLHQGPLALSLCPRFGGAITAFRRGDLDVLRPAGAAFFEAGEVRAASCFPLVPFSGRIADGRFRFRGRTHRVPPNFPPEPHAIHGDGWQNPWTLARVESGRAELAFAHHLPGTPLRYRARQTFELAGDGLRVGIEVSNAGTEPMPAGIGLHPYFVRTPGVTLRAAVEGVWLTNERNIPRERVPLPASWDFARGLRVADLTVDNGFDGWDGVAEIHWPETGLRLVIEAEPVFGHLVVYVPPERDFFCVEPVSHANDGFNLHDRGVENTGVRVLAPWDSLMGAVRFRIA
jgi:aldose 1-epimerase